MIYLQNKPKHPYIPVVFWTVLAALVFFNKTSALLHNALIGTAAFLLPDRVALEESKNNLLAVMQMRKAASDNEKLKEALRLSGEYRIIPANVKLGGGYLFLDTILINEGFNAGIKEGDAVITENNILIGIVSSVGNNWSKVRKTGFLGEKLTLIAADGPAASVIFEAVGLGGGELTAEFPTIRQNLAVKTGDAVRWGENHDFIVGLVDKVDFDENGSLEKITIIGAAPPFAAAVRVVSANK